MMCLTLFGPVLVIPNLPAPSLLHIPQGLGVGMTMAVGCQVVAVAVALKDVALLMLTLQQSHMINCDTKRKKTSIS